MRSIEMPNSLRLALLLMATLVGVGCSAPESLESRSSIERNQSTTYLQQGGGAVLEAGDWQKVRDALDKQEQVDRRLAELLFIRQDSCVIEQTIAATNFLQQLGPQSSMQALRRFIELESIFVSQDSSRYISAVSGSKILFSVVRALFRGKVDSFGIAPLNSTSPDFVATDADSLPFTFPSEVPFFVGVEARGLRFFGFEWEDVGIFLKSCYEAGRFATKALVPESNPVFAADNLLASAQIVRNVGSTDTSDSLSDQSLRASIRRQVIEWAIQKRVIGKSHAFQLYCHDSGWASLRDLCRGYVWDADSQAFLKR